MEEFCTRFIDDLIRGDDSELSRHFAQWAWEMARDQPDEALAVANLFEAECIHCQQRQACHFGVFAVWLHLALDAHQARPSEQITWGFEWEPDGESFVGKVWHKGSRVEDRYAFERIFSGQDGLIRGAQLLLGNDCFSGAALKQLWWGNT